ncbi:MAG: hypothetical protein H7343_19730 [Undibacterium sp.]|nr:hypothetical protein [Opitutaceae bacterium]
MPGRLLQTDAFILSKRPPADSFQTFTLFSAEHGALLALQRLPKKNAAHHLALDLFDEVALSLESSNQGSTWFIKEVRLLARPAGIGRSYAILSLASTFTAIIARNPVHEDSRAAVATLLRTALAAFATSTRPDIVFFKSLYCFARDEGYPVKQQWFTTLNNPDQHLAVELLNTPLAAQTAAPEDTTRLTRQLEAYLRSHTDILLD